MPEETIALTPRARHRLKVIEAVTDRRLTQTEAGGQLGLTPRQVKRLVAAYRARGAAGLVSQRLGQPSNRRLKAPLREAIRALLVARYPDFGPTLAQEKLYELHQIEVSIETVRQLQVELGLWKPQAAQGRAGVSIAGAAGAFWGADPDRRLAPRLVRGTRAALHPHSSPYFN
jgi:hypothetical protein